MGEIPSVWRQELLDHVKSVIRDDIARGRYFGAVIKVARGGEVGLETAIGDEGGPGTKPLGMESVFSIFSATKAITNVIGFSRHRTRPIDAHNEGVGGHQGVLRRYS